MKNSITIKGLLNIQQTTIDKNKTIDTVSARELWKFLESKQEFANWIKNRIVDYDFKEGVDYMTVDKIIKREKGATTIKEYYISISMAKELGMVERNEKGIKYKLSYPPITLVYSCLFLLYTGVSFL